MEGVGGAEVGAGWGAGEGGFYAVEGGVGEGEKDDFSSSNLSIELGKNASHRGWRSQTFAIFAKADGVELRPAVMRTYDLLGGGGEGLNLSGASLVPMELSDVVLLA